jgi:hypothetical protein
MVYLSVQITVSRSILLFSLLKSCRMRLNGATFAQAIWPSVQAVGRHFLTANEFNLSNSVGFVADELTV